MGNNVIWALVSCKSSKEARSIGNKILKARMAACYSLIPKLENKYYWPPNSGKFEISRGPLLVLETLPKNYFRLANIVKKNHSDKIPFIGRLEIKNVDSKFINWLQGEIK
jgi:periplasmic divalent cation tolerance protein